MYQIYNQPLASLAISASAKLKAPLRDLESQLGNAFLHLVGFNITAYLTCTYTAVPTQVGHNNLLAQVRFKDGVSQLWQLGGNSMRIMEKVEAGRAIIPEAETDNTSTNPRYFSRFFPLGPLGFAGGFKDFCRPCAALKNGTLEIDLGALTDISADTTAMSGTIEVEAVLVAREDIVVGPKVERREDDISNNDKLNGTALYTHLALVTGSDYASFAAGEIGNVTVKSGTKTLVPAASAAKLWRTHQLVQQAGLVGGAQGEPVNATYDTNTKEVNLGTPTALRTVTMDTVPVLFCAPGARISGLFAYVPSTLGITVSGSSTSHRAISTRILPNDTDDVKRIVDAAARELGIAVSEAKQQKLDKASGSPRGFERYMPVKFKIGRAA
jgi:hypothetical protein